MRTAFVAGATGYTGREVVRQLCASGVKTIAHVRPDSPSLEVWRSRFEKMGAIVDATSWQAASIEEALRRHSPDAVFALLGTTQTRSKSAAASGRVADYEAVDYGLTHMLVEGAQRVVPSATFVYLSVIGARADSSYEYARVRGRIEAELKTSGLTYIIARPVFISGADREERRPSERIGAVATDALLAVVGLVAGKGVQNRFRSITSERLARALIMSALDAIASNRVLRARDLQDLAG